MPDTRVFISYSSVDRMEALAVRRLLAARGCTVWLDVFDIRVSEDLKHELGDGIANADVFCLLLSPTAVASPWVAQEIERGKEQARQRGLRIVPVLLRPCRPPDALIGLVMLDAATSGIHSPDTQTRLARAVLGPNVVGDWEIDGAVQAALQDRQNELEAAGVLPELAKKLEPLRQKPIRKLQISFRHSALPRERALALRLTFDPLFSAPMWFRFAHYREGHTWPKRMGIEELDHSAVRSDGKRVDGRFHWFDRVTPMSAEIDGTDLRDLPATFNLELTGETWTPGGSISTYDGGPTVPHLPQRMEIPPLDTLIEKRAAFGVTLVSSQRGREQEVEEERNDLDIRVVATYDSGEQVTLFRSAHGTVERAVLKGAFLTDRTTQIEREAVLGLYPRVRELAAAERLERRRAAHELLEKAEEELSPEERRVAATLRYGQAKLGMFRIFANAPPPGPARQQLHETTLDDCRAVWRLLEPLVSADPEIDEAGMAYWAASSLADYYLASKTPDVAASYADAALSLAADASAKDANEPEYQRWTASAHQRLARAQAAAGEVDRAMASWDRAVRLLSGMCQELPNAGRRRDLASMLRSAIESSGPWTPADPSRRQAWMEMAARIEAPQAGAARGQSQ